MKKVAIIGGHDMGKTTLANMVIKGLNDKVEVVNMEDLDNETVEQQLERYFDSRQFADPIPYIAAPRFEMYGTKEFICKGKHQYREVKTECGDVYWTCQCGRTL